MAYSRMNALGYAKFFAYKVCPDGKIALGLPSGGWPTVINGVKLQPALPLEEIAKVIPHEDDCTHFLSCCIGRTEWTGKDGANTIHVKGGGLDLPTPLYIKAVGGYGFDNPDALLPHLFSRKAKFVKEFLDVKGPGNEITRQHMDKYLKLGDVLVYANKQKIFKHMVILVSRYGISCHSYQRWDVDFSLVGLDLVSLLQMPD